MLMDRLIRKAGDVLFLLSLLNVGCTAGIGAILGTPVLIYGLIRLFQAAGRAESKDTAFLWGMAIGAILLYLLLVA